MTTPSFSVVIPTLNAGAHIDALLAALRAQSAQCAELLVIDSASDDGTAERFEREGARVIRIARANFDHGETRNIALRETSGAFLLYLTQDVLPTYSDSFSVMLARMLAEPSLALVYGRQVPRPEAGPVEAHLREYNYPRVSVNRTAADFARLGVRAAFSSNAFAMYRRTALQSIGGFPHPVILAEDWVAAYRLLAAGYRVAYDARAVVMHSHDYGYRQELRLMFDVGVAHTLHNDILTALGGATRDGFRFAHSEYRYLRQCGQNWLVAGARVLGRNTTRWIGYQAGLRYRILPTSIVRAVTTQPQFWNGMAVAEFSEAAQAKRLQQL